MKAVGILLFLYGKAHQREKLSIGTLTKKTENCKLVGYPRLDTLFCRLSAQVSNVSNNFKKGR